MALKNFVIPMAAWQGRQEPVGVWLGSKRLAEELSGFCIKECMLIAIYIFVSLPSGFSAFPRLLRLSPRGYHGTYLPAADPFLTEPVSERLIFGVPIAMGLNTMH